jgi:hypothetical protein
VQPLRVSWQDLWQYARMLPALPRNPARYFKPLPTTRKGSIPARATTSVKAKADARPATMAARVRTLARARAAALPTEANLRRASQGRHRPIDKLESEAQVSDSNLLEETAGAYDLQRGFEQKATARHSRNHSAELRSKPHRPRPRTRNALNTSAACIADWLQNLAILANQHLRVRVRGRRRENPRKKTGF